MSRCRHVAICLPLPAGIQPQLYSGPQAWRTDYSTVRLHSSLGGLATAEFTNRLRQGHMDIEAKVISGMKMGSTSATLRPTGRAAARQRTRQGKSGASERLPIIAAAHWPQANGKADDEWPEKRVAQVRNRICPAHTVIQVIHHLIGQLGHDDKCERNEGTQRSSANEPDDHEDRQTSVNVKYRIRKPGSVSNP